MKATIIDIDEVFLPKRFGVILKEKPKNLILELNRDEAILMDFFYKKYDNQIDYNGKTFYLSDYQTKLLNDKGYDDLTLLGVAYRDDHKLNEEYCRSKSLKIAKQIEKNDGKLFLVSDISNKSLLDISVNTITKFLNIPVEKVFLFEYESSKINNKSQIEIFDKEKLLLSLLLGKKIFSNEITKTDIQAFTSIEYYSYNETPDLFDIYQNIENSGDIRIEEYIEKIKTHILK
jgi:hypothetical protein